VVSPDLLVILATDGLDCVPHERLVGVVREHADDPQALADALVVEPEIDRDGYRDDVTVVVLLSN
jgi:PPM family protein phosphatase